MRAGKAGFVFQFAARERNLLLGMLKLYPLVPAAHHQLSRQANGADDKENQRLLEELLAEQRRENQEQVLAMVNEPGRFREVKDGVELTLTTVQLEWLLQVLNDVRVGSWLALGEPKAGAEPELSPVNAKYLIALELCGAFQSLLLAALGVEESAEWTGE